jgi:hypothetical protein
VPTVPTDTVLVPVSTCANRRAVPPQRAPVPPVPTAGDAPIINTPVTVGPAPSSLVVAPGDVSGTPLPSPVPNPPQAPRLHPPPHPMVTRSCTGTLWPNLRYACAATTSVPEVPSSVSVCDIPPLSNDGQSNQDHYKESLLK